MSCQEKSHRSKKGTVKVTDDFPYCLQCPQKGSDSEGHGDGDKRMHAKK